MHFQQQKHELWMLGIITALLSVGFIAFFFYQREKIKCFEKTIKAYVFISDSQLVGFDSIFSFGDSCNLKSLKDTVDIPLSYLTEELQVVQLDNRDEAL